MDNKKCLQFSYTRSFHKSTEIPLYGQTWEIPIQFVSTCGTPYPIDPCRFKLKLSREHELKNVNIEISSERTSAVASFQFFNSGRFDIGLQVDGRDISTSPFTVDVPPCKSHIPVVKQTKMQTLVS